jgi:hypothetical protein
MWRAWEQEVGGGGGGGGGGVAPPGGGGGGGGGGRGGGGGGGGGPPAPGGGRPRHAAPPPSPSIARLRCGMQHSTQAQCPQPQWLEGARHAALPPLPPPPPSSHRVARLRWCAHNKAYPPTHPHQPPHHVPRTFTSPPPHRRTPAVLVECRTSSPPSPHLPARPRPAGKRRCGMAGVGGRSRLLDARWRANLVARAARGTIDTALRLIARPNRRGRHDGPTGVVAGALGSICRRALPGGVRGEGG